MRLRSRIQYIIVVLVPSIHQITNRPSFQQPFPNRKSKLVGSSEEAVLLSFTGPLAYGGGDERGRGGGKRIPRMRKVLRPRLPVVRYSRLNIYVIGVPRSARMRSGTAIASGRSGSSGRKNRVKNGARERRLRNKNEGSLARCLSNAIKRVQFPQSTIHI